MKTLTGKTIIVVGASGDIGSVISRVFHLHGANVVLTARTKESLLAVQQSIGTERTLVIPADASQAQEVESLFTQASNHFGSVDAIIITAGKWNQISIDDSVEEASALIDHHYKTIFRPVFITGWYAQQFFRKQKYGLIVHMSSHVAIRPELTGNGTYRAMKTAARHFILGLDQELHGTGVRAVDLMVAIVNTAKNQTHLDTEEKKKEAVQPEDIALWIINHFDDPNIPGSHLLDSTRIV